MKEVEFEKLKGVTLKEIRGLEIRSKLVEFITTCGTSYHMYHEQDCCEFVYLLDFEGEIEDLIGSPILVAEESTNKLEQGVDTTEYSSQWTFYKLATIKGSLDLRWHGRLNGYYQYSMDVGLYV